MKRVYLDSNVLISFVKNEIGWHFRLLFHDVEKFFAHCPKNFELVLSNHALREIEKIAYHSRKDVFDLFTRLEIKAEFVEEKFNDFELAKVFTERGIHFADALHAAIAVNAECSVLLTFNKKDFEKIREIEVKEPADLL